jgi:hypothetical protein
LPTSGKKAEHVARLQEVADREKAEARYLAMKNDELKETCRLNGQKVGGTKQCAPLLPARRALPRAVRLRAPLHA